MKQSLPVNYAKAILAMLFWALTFVWVKIALRNYHPIEIVTLRLVLATALMFMAILVLRHRERPARQDLPRFMLVAFCEPFCYFLGEANGMQYVSSTLGSLIISTIPLVTAIGAWLFLKEKVTVLLFVGLFVSFAGVALLTLESTELWATMKGVLLMLLAVFGGMFYGLTVRSLTQKYDPITIVTWQSLFGLLYFLPLFFILDGSHFCTMQHSGMGLLTIAGMSVFASVGAFLLYTGVIRDLGIIRSNLFTNLIPVLTVISALLILGDKPTLRGFLGIGLVIAGLVISQYRDIRRSIIPAE